MKINTEKIKKYQQGGYLTYRPLTRPPETIPQVEAPTNSSQSKSDSDDTVDTGVDGKSMQKLLGNGITNDVMAFSDNMRQVESRYASMTEGEREGPEGRQLRSTLRGNFGELNALIRSKDLFKSAYDKSAAQGGLEEFAVVPGGFVVKKADGTIDKVAFAQFAKDKSSDTLNYKPLTNAELAKEREYNKSLIGNSNIFSILEYSKGIDNVKKEVLEIATGLGKSSKSNSTGAYDEGTVEAIRTAQLAAGQGMFKIKESSSQVTNLPQINRAKEVMWSTLSDNSKNVLRARAAFIETDPSKIEQRAALLAMDLLDPRLDQSQTSASDMMATRPGKVSGKGSGESGGLDKMGEREAATQGQTQIENLSLLSDFGVQINSRMYTMPLEDVTRKKDGMNVKVSVANSKLAEYTFANNATTLDGQKIDPNNTMFTDEAYYVPNLPVIVLANGGLMLDEAGAKKMAAADAEIAAYPPDRINEMIREKIRKKHDADKLIVKRVYIAKAASYDSQYRLLGLLGKKDPKYFKEADATTTQLLGQTIDPDSDGGRNGLDYKAYSHLIILESKGNERFGDGNSLFSPKAGWDVTNPGRTPLYNGKDYNGVHEVNRNTSTLDFSNNSLNKSNGK